MAPEGQISTMEMQKKAIQVLNQAAEEKLLAVMELLLPARQKAVSEGQHTLDADLKDIMFHMNKPERRGALKASLLIRDLRFDARVNGKDMETAERHSRDGYTCRVQADTPFEREAVKEAIVDDLKALDLYGDQLRLETDRCLKSYRDSVGVLLPEMAFRSKGELERKERKEKRRAPPPRRSDNGSSTTASEEPIKGEGIRSIAPSSNSDAVTDGGDTEVLVAMGGEQGNMVCGADMLLHIIFVYADPCAFEGQWVDDTAQRLTVYGGVIYDGDMTYDDTLALPLKFGGGVCFDGTWSGFMSTDGQKLVWQTPWGARTVWHRLAEQ